MEGGASAPPSGGGGSGRDQTEPGKEKMCRIDQAWKIPSVHLSPPPEERLAAGSGYTR